MSAAATKQSQTSANGAAAEDPMVQAIAYEAQIAEEAAALRGDVSELSPELFLKLWPLLKRPIPAGFIQTVGKTQGKPYESTGVRSIQVQIDRMNNVLSPMCWWDKVSYDDDGKLAFVKVYIGNRRGPGEHDQILASAHSAGGVDRGSTTGNVYKGSYTNAAKRAFAALGPGHEVYLGATDLDPDVDADAAEAAGKEQKAKADDATIGNAIAKKYVDRIWELGDDVKSKLRLAVSHAAKSDVGDVDTKAKATKAIAALTYPAAEQLDRWITRKEKGGDDGGE